MLYKIQILSILIVGIGCKDECKQKDSFTIVANFTNGTTGGVYYNLPVTLRTENSDRQGFKHLAEGKTDGNGNATLSYSASSCDFLKLSISSVVYFSEELPARTSFSDTFYASTNGRLDLYLNTTKPLNPDTLFLFYSYSKNDVMETKFDTLYTATNGFYKTIIYNMAHKARFFYGRGINNFNKKYPNFPKDIHLKGDPVIDKFTINY